jgi:DNA polymerase elongation subunit (family B)
MTRKEMMEVVKAAQEQYEETVKNLNKLERVEKILKDAYETGEIYEYPPQAFNTRNTVGDPMAPLYEDDEISIDNCSYYGYVEIFGLSTEEFDTLMDNGVIRP